jgi:hypothetical protein
MAKAKCMSDRQLAALPPVSLQDVEADLRRMLPGPTAQVYKACLIYAGLASDRAAEIERLKQEHAVTLLERLENEKATIVQMEKARAAMQDRFAKTLLIYRLTVAGLSLAAIGVSVLYFLK